MYSVALGERGMLDLQNTQTDITDITVQLIECLMDNLPLQTE